MPPGAASYASGLLDGPILSTLLRLAAPNVMAMTTTVAVGVAETYYVGRLGVTPLAAMGLVFPFVMLTHMMSNGAMGGGVSSAVSRALGAGSHERASELASHAVIIGAVAGMLYSMLFLSFGPTLYAWLGGRDAVLGEAIGYASVVFSGALLIWLSNTLASVLRGTGNMRVPSVVAIGAALLQIVCGGLLGLGLGPIPSLGLPGVAMGNVVAMSVASIALWWFIDRGQTRVQLRWRGKPIRRALLADILRVGALSCLSPVMSVLTVVVLTGMVARLGVAPLAGYAIGQRMEFMLIPIAFGIGVASVPMVGMAIGARNFERARRVAWTAGAVSAFKLAVLGAIVALWPDVWAGVFTSEPEVLASAREYLRIAGPAFPMLGLGLTLYFASQGAGQMAGPVLAAAARLALVVMVGWWLSSGETTATALFALIAGAMVLYGVLTSLSVKLSNWGHR